MLSSVFLQAYICLSRDMAAVPVLHYPKWGLTIALYDGTIKPFSYVIFLRIIPITLLLLDTAILHRSC